MRFLIKDKKFYIQIITIALPIVLQSLITIGVNTTDTIMLGSFGEQQLSAASLSNQFYSIFQIFCFGVGGGAAVMTSRLWGRGDSAGIKKVIAIMLRIAITAGFSLMLLTAFFPGAVLSLYTDNPATIGYGIKYFSFLCYTFLFQGISLTLSIVMRSVGAYFIPLVSSASSFLLNIFFNWVFIFGKLGAPELQIQGAAIGTLIARFVEVSIMVFYLLVVDKRIGFKGKDLFSDCKEVSRQYLKYSTPVIISDIILAVGNNYMSVIMMKIGVNFVAAHAITLVVVQISTFFTLAVSNAASIIIGNTLGKGSKETAQTQGTTFLFISIILGVLASIITIVLKPIMIDFYNVTAQTKEIAIQLMNAVGLTVIFRTISSVLTKGILRGGGDTRYMMMADVLFLWIGSIPLGALTGLVLHTSPFITYCCLNIDLVIKSFWCIHRLYSKKWIKDIRLSTRLDSNIALKST